MDNAWQDVLGPALGASVVGTARVRATARAHPLARARAESALEAADLATGSPGELLIVRRVSAPLGRTVAGQGRFSARVRQELARAREGAGAPGDHSALAVRFANVDEMMLALALDLAARNAGGRWYWRTIGRLLPATALESLAAFCTACPRLWPALVASARDAGMLATLVEGCRDDEAVVALEAIVRAFGLPSGTTHLQAPVVTPGREAAAETAPESAAPADSPLAVSSREGGRVAFASRPSPADPTPRRAGAVANRDHPAERDGLTGTRARQPEGAAVSVSTRSKHVPAAPRHALIAIGLALAEAPGAPARIREVAAALVATLAGVRKPRDPIAGAPFPRTMGEKTSSRPAPGLAANALPGARESTTPASRRRSDAQAERAAPPAAVRRPPPARDVAALPVGAPTQLGGVMFLVNLLDADEMLALCGRGVIDAIGNWAAFAAVACAVVRWAFPAEIRALARDPLWAVLATLGGAPVRAGRQRAWARAAALILARRLAHRVAAGDRERAAVRDALRRRARIAATRTHLDVVFPIDQAEATVRRAALDLDPGWVPWLGRVIRFHYE